MASNKPHQSLWCRTTLQIYLGDLFSCYASCIKFGKKIITLLEQAKKAQTRWLFKFTCLDLKFHGLPNRNFVMENITMPCVNLSVQVLEEWVPNTGGTDGYFGSSQGELANHMPARNNQGLKGAGHLGTPFTSSFFFFQICRLFQFLKWDIFFKWTIIYGKKFVFKIYHLTHFRPSDAFDRHQSAQWAIRITLVV